MRRPLLIVMILVALAASIGVPLWFNQHQPSGSATQPTAPEKSIDIQHALINRNDTTIGRPLVGYVYVDFSLLIMNCGYNEFEIAPLFFLLETGGTTYSASNATANMPNHMNDTVLRNGQEVFAEIAYQIPANSVSAIPLTPLTYSPSQGYTINWVSNW